MKPDSVLYCRDHGICLETAGEHDDCSLVDVPFWPQTTDIKIEALRERGYAETTILDITHAYNVRGVQ